jgi:hypothetical protein
VGASLLLLNSLTEQALFADGSAGMVIGTQPRAGETPLFELHHSLSHIIPNTLPMMSWELSKSGLAVGQCLVADTMGVPIRFWVSFTTGMIIGLDKEIPHEIYKHIELFSERMMPTNIKPGDCTWAIHPGNLILGVLVGSGWFVILILRTVVRVTRWSNGA